jgi:hypothetical protein
MCSFFEKGLLTIIVFEKVLLTVIAFEKGLLTIIDFESARRIWQEDLQNSIEIKVSSFVTLINYY